MTNTLVASVSQIVHVSSSHTKLHRF